MEVDVNICKAVDNHNHVLQNCITSDHNQTCSAPFQSVGESAPVGLPADFLHAHEGRVQCI